MALHALVIDGQPDVRRLVAIKLGHAGFAVSMALDGQDGLAKALTEMPDVVVLDALTPRADGFFVAREIQRELGDRAPVIIMLSAHGAVADIAQGLQSGADDYLVKPFAPRELIERIVVALIRRGRAAELPVSLDVGRAAEHAGRHGSAE